MEKEHKTDGTPCWCNPKVIKVFPKSELFEKLAAIEHERWADWQKFVHSNSLEIREEEVITPDPVSGLLIPNKLVNKWEKQIETPYKKLSKAEKDSDRKQVMRYWNLIVEAEREAYERAIKNYG